MSFISRSTVLIMTFSLVVFSGCAKDPRSPGLAACDDAPESRVLTIDAVEAARGRTVVGKRDLALLHEGIVYRFVSAKNRATFERDPARFEVADGGACGRMGPLSGTGDARRHFVHEGRVYFFASDACREAFIQNPSRYIEIPDQRPTGTPEEIEQGRALLATLIDWAGGESKIRSIRSYRETTSRTVESGGTSYSVTHEFAAILPDRFREWESWNDSWFSTIRSENGAAMASSRRHEPIGDSRVKAFDRVLARHPVVILTDAVRDSGSERSFIAIAHGSGESGESAVDHLVVWTRGAMTTLSIERGTGRLVQARFHGRDSGTSIGDVVREYTGDAMYEGVRLPISSITSLHGARVPGADSSIDSFEINPVLDDSIFDPEPPHTRNTSLENHK
ncbi:MAG: hypothetical protein IPK69_06005 [Phycisphaerales bacterium]|nr:MAG: hypothetical protein IPK69_06005 [Phycisphaerales bacterium]